jgi:hypothetical protein
MNASSPARLNFMIPDRAGDVKYVWPLQQPVSDLDTQKSRVKKIRSDLGWSLVGCELIECYDEH